MAQSPAAHKTLAFFSLLICLLLALTGACAMVPQTAFAASTFQAENGNVYYYGPLGNGVVIYGVVELVDPNVIIPDEIDGLPVTIIWQSAFSMYDGRDFIETVTLPESLTCVGFNAFKNCSNLRSVEAHGSFSMQKQAFAFCENLTEFNYTGDMSNFALDKYPSKEMWDTYKGTPFEGSRNVAFTAEQCDGLAELVDMINTTSAEAGDAHHLTYSVIGTNPEPEPDSSSDSDSDQDDADSGGDSSGSAQDGKADASGTSSNSSVKQSDDDNGATSVVASTQQTSVKTSDAALSSASYRKVNASTTTPTASSSSEVSTAATSSESKGSDSPGGTAALLALVLAVVVFGGVFEATRYTRSMRRQVVVPGASCDVSGEDEK